MYLYDADGIRTQKTVDGVTTQYFVSGSTILAEKTGSNVIWYIYDSDGEILGFIYNLTPYYYIKNMQGDVCKVVNESGTVVASYTYDPWGKVLSATGSMAEINPIRYRGYYYDSESGLYYLNSRYYDPEQNYGVVEMRCLRCVFTVPLILLLIISGGVEAFAMNTGFTTNELSQKDMNALRSNVNISVLTDEPPKSPIYCFDVNEEGRVAVVCMSFEQKTICVYDDSGFLYGFALNSSGSIGVEWDNDKDINIYFIRSDVIVTVNPNGEIVEALEVQDTIENNSYRNRYIYATSRTVGDTIYSLRNNMGILNFFATSYSQIIVKDSTGFENVIYDVNSIQLTNMIVIISLICVFVLVVITVVFGQFTKLRRSN